MSSTTLTFPLSVELSPFTILVSPVITTSGSVQPSQYDIDSLATMRGVLFGAVSAWGGGCFGGNYFFGWVLRRVGSLGEKKKTIEK